MTGSEIASLTNLLVSTWPSGVKGHVWTEVLNEQSEVEYRHARAAYANLRDEAERNPSVKNFLDCLRTVEARSRPRRPTDCGDCHGHGWVECLDDRRHASTCRDRSSCSCHAVVPCPACSTGHPRPVRETRPN